jgi:hypothetical protein
MQPERRLEAGAGGMKIPPAFPGVMCRKCLDPFNTDATPQLVIDYFSCITIIACMTYAQRQEDRYERREDHPRQAFSSAHVSLGGVKYAVGAIALMLLGEKIRNPEQRYLVLAGLGAIVGAIDTAWRDHVRARERADKDARWRERCERNEPRERERN